MFSQARREARENPPPPWCLPGAGASGFVGNLYLPAGFNNFSHAETRTAFAFGGFAVQNLLREFAPDLLKATHKWHTPFPRIPVPEWWVKHCGRHHSWDNDL